MPEHASSPPNPGPGSDPPARLAPEAKICGLTRRRDAEAARAAGADYLGVVLVPSSPRHLSVEQACTVLAGFEDRGVAVTADLEPDRLARAARALGVAALQLHGEESPERLRALRDQGEWELWKAIRVREAGDFERAVDTYSGVADALLLDGWHPTRQGGTGTRFPWEEVGRVRSHLGELPFRLGIAGGLRASNVAGAVALLDPDFVDVSSGVESSPGIKDAAEVERFIRNARGRAARSGSLDSRRFPAARAP